MRKHTKFGVTHCRVHWEPHLASSCRGCTTHCVHERRNMSGSELTDMSESARDCSELYANPIQFFIPFSSSSFLLEVNSNRVKTKSQDSRGAAWDASLHAAPTPIGSWAALEEGSTRGPVVPRSRL